MSELYMMVTITNRKYMSRFAALYRENQIEVGTVSLGMGTASSFILDLFSLCDSSYLEKGEKGLAEPAADRRARNRDCIYHSHEQHWRQTGTGISHSGSGVCKRGGRYIERDKA